MKTVLMIVLLTLSVTTKGLTPSPNSAKPVNRVFINATLHIGNGQVLHNAKFGIADGIIQSAGHDKKALTGDEIDLKGKHIYPGFILTNTNLGLTEVDSFKATVDSRETGQLNPNVRTLTSFNTDSERIPTMRFNGILLAQSTPSGGLVSGTSSVVQLDAWNWEDAAVKADDGLHVNWPNEWNSRFDRASGSMQMKQDKKYAEKVRQIKDLFAEAQADTSGTNLKLNAVKSVFNGEKKLYLHSNSPKAIIAGLNYFQSLDLPDVVLVTGQAAEEVIDFIKQTGVAVIVNAVHTLPKLNDNSIDAVYTLPGKLAEAGILTAIAYPGSMSARNLPFTAGSSIAYGNSPASALQMITANPAKILGIDQHYGTLELGKSATFFISEGDALDMRGNHITEAYIDGRPIALKTRQQKLYERYKNKYQQ